MNHRAFSIIELIVVIATIALMMPPTLTALASTARARASAARATTAITLAESIAEHIIADANAHDPDIGFDALSDPHAALYNPDTGIHARFQWLIGHHAALGYQLDLQSTPPIALDGATTGDPELDLFRRITVIVEWSDPAAGPQSFRLPFLIARQPE